MRAIGLLVTLALTTPGAALAQTTPWGEPDLQGVWSNQTPIPLERPVALAGKPTFTRQEAAEVEKNALGSLLKILAGGIPTSGELNEVWLESAKGKVGRNLSTSLIVDPPDGKIPFTKEGRARWDATPSLQRELMGRPNLANEPRDRTLDERCITTGGVLVPNPFYNNYHRIVQAPGYVVIVTEMMHEHRVIPVHRRPPLGANIRQWLGESRGWWEGKTLVVETTNFTDQMSIGFNGNGLRHSDQMRLVERFTRVDAQTIQWEVTIDDPKTYTKPFKMALPIRLQPDYTVFEYACHEGNYGMRNILSAARASEAGSK
jgi:hypothetical protein